MADYSIEEDPRPVHYAARQPILADDETVIGYKLMFRSGMTRHFRGSAAETDSRTTIDMSSLLGLRVLCDNRLAFIDCTREVLLERFLAFLPAETVVAEIGHDVLPDEVVCEALSWLRHAGYKVAIDDFSPGDAREPLTEFADFLKIDIKTTPWEEALAIPRRYGNREIGLVAEKVETREDFEFARSAGFHFFQGYFFRRPETMRARGMAANRATYLRLMRAVSREQMDWDEVEDLLKQDSTLYLRLLRYLNSPLFGIRGEVRSVNQALTFLGENELRRWCRLAGAFEMSKHRASDLMLTALVRARFGELLAPSVDHGGADLFLVGLLSLMDAVLEIPMSAVVEGLALDESSATLLLDNAGPLLPVYELVWDIERAAWRSVVRRCAALGLNEEEIAEQYTQAMEWAQSVTTAD